MAQFLASQTRCSGFHRHLSFPECRSGELESKSLIRDRDYTGTRTRAIATWRSKADIRWSLESKILQCGCSTRSFLENAYYGWTPLLVAVGNEALEFLEPVPDEDYFGVGWGLALDWFDHEKLPGRPEKEVGKKKGFFRVLSGYPQHVVFRRRARPRLVPGPVEAAEPAAHVDPTRRDPQSLGIPAEFHRLLEIAARFPQLPPGLLLVSVFAGRCFADSRRQA